MLSASLLPSRLKITCTAINERVKICVSVIVALRKDYLTGCHSYNNYRNKLNEVTTVNCGDSLTITHLIHLAHSFLGVVHVNYCNQIYSITKLLHYDKICLLTLRTVRFMQLNHLTTGKINKYPMNVTYILLF